ADGRVQDGNFATAGVLELRGLNGAPLLALLPPSVRHIGGAALQATGRYQVTETADGVVIAAQTPAAFWSSLGPDAAASLLVAAFTPTMQVVQDLENASVTRLRDYDDDKDPIGPGITPWDIRQGQTCVGNFVNELGSDDYRLGYDRGYVRFPLPSLPYGVSQPSSAIVVAVPDSPSTSDDPSHKYYSDRIARQPTYLLEMTEDWTDDLLTPGVITTNSYPAGMASTDPAKLALIKKADPGTPNKDALPVTTWDATSVVQGWYANPASNHGFALRLFWEDWNFFETEFPPVVGDPVFTHPTRMCFPSSANWSNLDDVVANLGDTSQATADGAGLGLLVTYSSSQLPSAEFTQLISVPSAIPLQSYRYQFHEYRFPAPVANRWQVVAAQGRTPPADGLSPNVPLDLIDADGQLLVSSDAGKPASLNADYEWQPNYLVVNGDQGALGVRVQPDNQPTEFHNGKLYDVQTQYATPSPSLPVGTQTQVTVELFRDLVQGQELNLPANTTVEVRIPYTATTPALSQAGAPMYDLQVFPAALPYAGRVSGGMALTRGPDAYEIEFTVGPGQDGRWLLLLNANQQASTIDMPAQVTLCANNDQVVRYPLDGECVELRRPPTGFASDPTYYQELGSGAGRLRLYSPAGFDCSGSQCTTRPKDPDDIPVMPMLGYGDDDVHWVALKNGTYTRDTNLNQIFTSPDARLVMADFSDPNLIASLPVLRGEFRALPGNPRVTAISSPQDTYLLVKSPMHVQDDKGGDGDKNGWSYQVDMSIDRLAASGPVVRTVAPTPGEPSVDFEFDAAWSISVEGGPSLQGNITLQSVSAPDATFALGSLLVTAPNSGYSLEFSPLDVLPGFAAVIPCFAHIRMVGATLAQPAETGGAQLPVQGLLLPPGRSIKDESGANPSVLCGDSCFDLRGEEDEMTSAGHNRDREYTMPDLIVQDAANLVLVNLPGRLEAFSADHPLAANTNTTSFSFEAFEATVTTYFGECPRPRDPLNPGQQVGPPAEKKTVIIGQAVMAIPNADAGSGDTTGGARIQVDFTLCDTSLRELGFTFDTGSQYAIPIGNSGLWLNLIGGTVSLAPQAPNSSGYTTITLRFGFRGMSMAASASNLFFTGAVTIDSRGLFDVQVQAAIQVSSLAGVGVDGHFWVAWSPLDLGYIVQACVPKTVDAGQFPYPAALCEGNELLTGLLKMHIWQGQGWQNKYSWLPDDGAVHAAARFEAKITLATGSIIEWGLVVLPPSDIVLAGLKFAFGEFCQNSACTVYEWGVMGAFTIIGYDIGAYYGFDSGISFIMGSADYVLIDEAGQAMASPGVLAKSLEAQPQQQVISLQPGLPSALFGLAATSNSASLTLYEPPPGNRVITSNPPSVVAPDLTYSNTLTTKGFQTMVSVQDPAAGDWTVEINGVGAGAYNFFYFANNPAPSLSLNALPDQVIDGTSIPIDWTSNISAPGAATLSLYYEKVSGGLTTTQEIAGPIVERIPLTPNGTYNWDITNLASGSYQVYARIDNQAAVALNSCADQTYNPDPTQQSPCGLMLAPGLVLPVERVPAPGTVRIFDTIPPAPPPNFEARAEGISSVVGRWQPNTESDLAGYVTTCTQGVLTRKVRSNATIEATSPLSETARVNGLQGVPATCSVQAYDASGNLSGPSNTDTATPSASLPLPPAAVQNVQIQPGNLGQVTVQWTASPGALKYLIYYHVLLGDDDALRGAGPAGLPVGGYQADQGPSPLVTNDTSQVLTGLPGGETYNVWVVPLDAEGRAGEPSAEVTFRLEESWLLYLPVILR
ncbi:MAG: hypothetical protein PVJ26_15245, partial [Anaerolineae bacterium]